MCVWKEEVHSKAHSNIHGVITSIKFEGKKKEILTNTLPCMFRLENARKYTDQVDD